jgi:hypothetical protein
MKYDKYAFLLFTGEQPHKCQENVWFIPFDVISDSIRATIEQVTEAFFLMGMDSMHILIIVQSL